VGHVKIDTNAKERTLEQCYALDNPEGVRLLLGDYHALKIRRFNGDYAASDILIDLETAINRAGLTDRQRQALRLVYVDDLTQEDAGIKLGHLTGKQSSKQTVNRLVNVASVKVARVYEYWARHGEGYSITTEGETENEQH
jgi:predicted DNA-binding protein (UPF0251 family)